METIDLLEYTKSRFEYKSSSHDNVIIQCPYHDDHNPSMMVGNGFAYCFACGTHVSGEQFIRDTGGPTHIVVQKHVRKHDRKVRVPSSRHIELAHRVLMRMPSKIGYLTQRGIAISEIKRYRLGYIRPPIKRCILPRFVVPGYDIEGNLVTASYRKDPTLQYSQEYPERGKYLTYPGTCPTLYNAQRLHETCAVMYVGGQLDVLALVSQGINAVGPMGDGSVKEIWREWIGDKRVYILLDNDMAGHMGSIKAHKMFANSIVLQWPPGTSQKYDITDALLDEKVGIDGIIRIVAMVGGKRTAISFRS